MPSWFRNVWDGFFHYVESLFEEHKFVRRTIVFVSLGLTIYTVGKIFDTETMMIVSQSPNGGWYAGALAVVQALLFKLMDNYMRLRELDK